VQVEELWSLDEDSFAALRPVHGLFFLFKWQKDKSRRSNTASSIGSSESSDVFFCNQTINNACGTIALLHVLLNNSDIALGSTLQEFKTSALEFPPDLRGLVLGNEAIWAAVLSQHSPVTECRLQDSATQSALRTTVLRAQSHLRSKSRYCLSSIRRHDGFS
jgi:ubiquitin carboxyl-terminal hydrolase L5